MLAEDSCWQGSCCTGAVVGETCEPVVGLYIGETGHVGVPSKSTDCIPHIKNVSKWALSQVQ